jgi:hypothetical protein
MEYLKWLGRFYGLAFGGHTSRAIFGCAMIGLVFGAVLFIVSRTSYLSLQKESQPSPDVTVTGGNGSVNTGVNNGQIDVDPSK